MDDDDLFDNEDVCDGCGRNLNEGGAPCPMCCANGGFYKGGTEECDFCAYSDECSKTKGLV